MPFYATLHAITFDIGILSSTFAGVIILAGSVFILIFVPWLTALKYALLQDTDLFIRFSFGR
nr:hypothetical protein [Bartonella quintana]